MQSLYNASDVFVFPSIKEGWGHVALEAMASGVPVVASGIEPMTEYLIDSENALLISPMDYTDLAEKIMTMFYDIKSRAKLIKNAMSTASMYSWENAARAHIDYYNDIIGGNLISKDHKRAAGND